MLWEFTAFRDLELRGDGDRVPCHASLPSGMWGSTASPVSLSGVGGIEEEASPEAKIQTVAFIFHSTLRCIPGRAAHPFLVCFLGASQISLSL